ncbi:precorrin-2 C(20)-methyltransferase [Zhaonella formicivorans]|uniref:precorrin-2 C(20)-methyltransferase n=1 Tax=Zhaonella formicivorans TaxID=2528593 RepID=UPI0010EFB8A9|nr:precorrin-2 C(20)-methyltransferase [Zhaonella formicivorans]
MKGKFIGIGIGPGDPELLTLKALRLLQETEIICVPKAGKEKKSIAQKIIEPHLTGRQKIVELVMPMTKDKVELHTYWTNAAQKIMEYLRQGKNVACVTLGDASLYSTYSYLQKYITTLDPEIEVETVPGITSFAAAAARLNLSLAEGNERLGILPAVEDVSDLDNILDKFSNLVLMKVSAQFQEIVEALERKSLAHQAVMISRCGQPGERIVRDLPSQKGTKPDYLSLILVKQGGDEECKFTS